MTDQTNHCANEHSYRSILGVRFFVGDAPAAVELGARGGLVVVPAAPALVELGRDQEYRQALLEADLVITDSGLMVLLWNFLARDHRVSGLPNGAAASPAGISERTPYQVMPSKESRDRNLGWLHSQGFPVKTEDCYLAPKYPAGPVTDEALVGLVNQRRPRHVIIGVGGGTQEKLGLHLKHECTHQPAIHCVGAAIGFLSGDQVRIPPWADRWILGWLFRCFSNPRRFFPRYVRALRLVPVLWRYRSRMPVCVPVSKLEAGSRTRSSCFLLLQFPFSCRAEPSRQPAVRRLISGLLLDQSGNFALENPRRVLRRGRSSNGGLEHLLSAMPPTRKDGVETALQAQWSGGGHKIRITGRMILPKAVENMQGFTIAKKKTLAHRQSQPVCVDGSKSQILRQLITRGLKADVRRVGGRQLGGVPARLPAKQKHLPEIGGVVLQA